MLILAREAAGITQTELAEAIGATQSRISKLEDGLLLSVTEEDLEAFGRVLRRPPHFFTQAGESRSACALFYRKRAGLPSRLLNSCDARMNIQRMEIERLVRNAELAAKPLPTIDPDEVKGGAAQVARMVRAAWDVPRGPIKNLTALVEDAGVIAVHFDFGTQKLDGVSMWGDRGNIPIVFLNRGFPSGRMRLTLAHELGHLVMHRTPKASMEDEAYEFAAEFLMPEADIVSSFYPVGLDELARLKVHWRVSMQALLKRAESLGVMTPRYSRYLWMLMGKHGYRTREPHDELIPRESPGLVHELVQLHTGELGYSPAELARVLAATEEDFEERYQSGDSPVTILR